MLYKSMAFEQHLNTISLLISKGELKQQSNEYPAFVNLSSVGGKAK
jgi:hypothetical protein